MFNERKIMGKSLVLENQKLQSIMIDPICRFHHDQEACYHMVFMNFEGNPYRYAFGSVLSAIRDTIDIEKLKTSGFWDIMQDHIVIPRNQD
jgi:hypothetical protein